MRITNALFAALVGCTLIIGQEPTAPASRPGGDAIKAQIGKLDNDSFDVRTKAMDELRAAGEAARADLEAATKSPSLEVRTRAESLLKDLDDRAAGKKPKTGLKALAPEAERPTEQPAIGGGERLPRREDFQDPQAYVEALRKWMEQWQKDSRFPRFVLPEDTDLDTQVFTLSPNEWVSGSSVSVEHRDGETRTLRSGSDGVTLKVERKDENGKTVVESWSAKSLEEFKANHPDVWEKYHPADSARTFQSWTRSAPSRLPSGTVIWPGGQIERTVPIEPVPGLPMPEGNQPRLGVMPSVVPPVLDKHLKLKGEGMVIDSVTPNSLASRLGIQEMDVLVRLDGEVIRERQDIGRVLGKKDAPANVTARVIREGAVVELTAPREKTR